VVETPPPSLFATLRCLRDPECAGLGPVGIAEARHLIVRQEALSEDPKTWARRDPAAEPEADSLAKPTARSSSGGSSPVVLPAYALRGVAG